MENKGQINIGSVFGDMLRYYSALPWVHNIVEIGTWNGLGSTLCIIKGLESSKKNKMFISIEASLPMYQKSSNIYNLDWVKIIYGRILEKNEMTFDFDKLENPFKQWADEDIKNCEMCPNIFNQLPSKIDLLLLDGGEFTTFDEFIKIKDRTTLFFLDDTKTFKNSKTVEYICQNKDFEVLADFPDDRNGFMVAKRVLI